MCVNEAGLFPPASAVQQTLAHQAVGSARVETTVLAPLGVQGLA